MVLLKSVCESALEHSSWAPLTEEERLSPFISWAASLTLIAHCSIKVCRTFVRNRIFCSVFMKSHCPQHLGLLESNYLMFLSLSYPHLMNAVPSTLGSFSLQFWRVFCVVLFCWLYLALVLCLGSIVIYFFHDCLKEFCQEGRKHIPEPYFVKHLKFFWLLEDSPEM